MSTFTGECQQTPNTSVKDQIFHYILVHSEPHRCMPTITDMLWWRSKREEPTKRRLVVSRQIRQILCSGGVSRQILVTGCFQPNPLCWWSQSAFSVLCRCKVRW
ncbi:hypothetical protein NPIL_167031 [Nephila pilipes]|uniref:Uncharacterized protein n=1 Tax=Nephila pilipes TaxID=299642 RepID=A0A8X6UBU7_NEPPI|nr:hypothetical protein NPIL_167031 [Nephila pilipes]